MSIPQKMSGLILTGHGGPEKLEWRDDLAVPTPAAGEVLIRIAASSVNNTDINTRIGWYSKSVTGDTESALALDGVEAGGWSGALSFPLIQGADCCGHIAAVGDGVDPTRLGQRILVRALQNRDDATWTFGSECSGAFAQYCVARDADAIQVKGDWTDTELASIPCAYSTAEGMIQRVRLGAERVLITGASGGVGSAAVQLAKLRGAEVVAVTSDSKAAAVRDLGADQTIGRDAPFGDGFDVVLDLVGGARFPDMLDSLKPQGRYAVAGAIAGPIVDLDLRTLYLKDLDLLGSTKQPGNILPDVISYIESGRLTPRVARIFDLKDIAQAQEAFLSKDYVGKIALTVP